MTKYHVLRSTGVDTYALIDTEVEASSAETAMRIAAKEKLTSEELAAGVTLVAVPVSNWTEEPVGVKQPPPRLVIGGEQITVEEALAEDEADPDPEVKS